MAKETSKNDNRNYKYQINERINRPEYKIIEGFVQDHSNILDLGCGDGSLLQLLIENKNCKGLGFEISESGVESAKNKNLKVIKRRIDEKFTDIKDKAFDYSICNVTLQMVMYPEILLLEMRRISKYQIVSFPNFADFNNRLDLILHGRMPRPLLSGYTWYNTGHIHQLSIKDFEEFCKLNDFQIIKKTCLNSKKNRFKRYLTKKFMNLFCSNAVFLLSSDNLGKFF